MSDFRWFGLAFAELEGEMFPLDEGPDDKEDDDVVVDVVVVDVPFWMIMNWRANGVVSLFP